MSDKTDERDPKTGRFLKGKSGSKAGRPPGNPWLNRIREKTDMETWDRIIASMHKCAEDGNVKAAALLMRYNIPNSSILPKPLKGELVEQLAQIKVELAGGNLNTQTATVLARIVALENLLSQSGVDGKILTIADVNQILNTEIDV